MGQMCKGGEYKGCVQGCTRVCVYKGVKLQGGEGCTRGGEVTNEVWVSVRVLGIGRVMVRRVTEGRGS